MERGTPFALAHTFRQTGPFRPAQRRPPGARTGVRRLVHRARRRRADGAGVGQARRRPRPARWSRPVTVTLEDELRRVPPAEQAPRHDVLLVDDGAADGQAPPRPRPLRVLPLRRRHRRRPRAGAGARAGRRAARRSATASSPTSSAGSSDDLVLKAVVHTVRAFDIDPEAFRRFLRSMTMDLTVESYATYDDLLDYMDGSAAVIGEMMLPILEPPDLGGRAWPGPRPRRGVPADELPARHRRGPRPRPPVRAPGGPQPVRRRPHRAPVHAGVRRADALRDRPLPRAVRRGRRRASPCSRRARRAASPPPTTSTAGSSTASRRQDYDVFPSRARVATPVKLAVAVRHLRR